MIIQQTQEQKALGLIAVNGMDETNFVTAHFNQLKYS
jgi:hypothetical protein